MVTDNTTPLPVQPGRDCNGNGNGNGNGAAESGPLAAALSYLAAGLSVIPIRPDGTKAPAGSWGEYILRLPTEEELRRALRDGRRGVGIVCGKVSGNLEVIDFDRGELFAPWCELVEVEAPGLVARLCVVRTPREPAGFHVRYRCPEVTIPGNTKLALASAPGTDSENGKPSTSTMIETRGEGGQALAPGCPPSCHPTGRLYEYHSGPPLERIPSITAAEREILIRCARSFDRTEEDEEKPAGPLVLKTPGLSPGDDYNQRGPSWADILERHGWSAVHHSGPVTYWRRPGKDGPGWSATTGYCTAKDGGHELFAVFSTNASPFPGSDGNRKCSTHSKFAVYALLDHGGDFSAAAKALAACGYGRGTQEGRKEATGHERGAYRPDHEQDAHLTDLGNAQRVVRRHGADMKFCHPFKRWFIWDGHLWQGDDTGAAVRRVKETQAALYGWASERLREMGDVGDDQERKAESAKLVLLLKHLLKWEDANRIGATLELAKSEPGVPVLPKQLDCDSWLFNVANGTIELRTGVIREHRREDLLTKTSPVVYDPAATCPRWLSFLDRVMDGNTDLTTYLQRVAGYSLTGDVGEQCLWFFHGAGCNGKSTYLATMLAMMGDYGLQAVSELLMAKKSESHPTERADLCGRRLVCTVETDEGKRMAESLMKQLTGGDKVTARRLYQEFFQFEATWKIQIAANHKPVIHGTDNAVWRRIKLVPFTVTIPDAEKDPKLPTKLRAELPGILAWAVRGCLDWQRHGLGEPEEVTRATDAYRAEQDLVAGFLGECCFANPEVKVQVGALFDAYLEWSGDKFTTQKAFLHHMEEKGYVSKAGGGNRRFFHGLGLPADGGS